MRTEFTVFVIKQDPKVQVKWPDGITVAGQSVKMRKTAIKNNTKSFLIYLINLFRKIKRRRATKVKKCALPVIIIYLSYNCNSKIAA